MKKKKDTNKLVTDLSLNEQNTPPFSSLSRRKFLGNVGGVVAIGMASGAIGLEPLLGSKHSEVRANEIGPETPNQRLGNAAAVRLEALLRDQATGIPEHPCNKDEENLINFIGNYSKGLQHNSSTGEVNPAAYNAFRNALSVGTFAAIENLIPFFGSNNQNVRRRLVNPMAGYAFELESRDSHQLRIPPAPRFSSAEEAGEMVELYWMALLRDVNFNDYAINPLAIAAAEDLSNLSDFRGPKENGNITPQTLFRDNLPGTTVGPYISQFLLKDAPYGAQRVDQRIQTAVAGIDFGTTFTSWLDIQLGIQPSQPTPFDDLRFARNGRDMGQYVHVDALYQAYQVASLVLLGSGLRWDENNPYGQQPEPGSGLPLAVGTAGARAQVGFGTFGGPDILATLCEVSTRALRAVWFQKWLVHRRLRPEAFGGRAEVIRLGRRSLREYPIHPDLFDSTVLPRIFNRNGTFLLPLAFPEGSPLHPSYGAGHATVAGACVTFLKAVFDEDEIIPDPVVASSSGESLEPFVGPPLTVGGELNKVASNIATARNIAGVHWRSDGIESLRLGEEITINVLRNMRETFREPFVGYRLTKFDGTTVNI